LKKGCLISVAVSLVLLVCIVAAVVIVTDRRMGYLEARPVSHEEVAPDFTRFRLALHPEKLAEYTDKVMQQGTVPGWLPMDSNRLAENLIPHELALLGSANYVAGQVGLRLFVNERRGGPLLPELARQQGLLENLSRVRWADSGLRFERRGVLVADGTMPIPDGLEERVRQDWDIGAGDEAYRLEGGHLAEAVLDNRNGEAALLLGALMDQTQQLTWRQHFESPNLQILLDLLTQVTLVRLSADLASIDALRINLRIEAHPEAAPSFNTLSMLLPTVKDSIRDLYDLELEGRGEWSVAEEAFIGEFRLSGLAKKLLPAPESGTSELPAPR
jgi:hypothetical protein